MPFGTPGQVAERGWVPTDPPGVTPRMPPPPVRAPMGYNPLPGGAPRGRGSCLSCNIYSTALHRGALNFPRAHEHRGPFCCPSVPHFVWRRPAAGYARGVGVRRSELPRLNPLRVFPLTWRTTATLCVHVRPAPTHRADCAAKQSCL